MKNNILLKYSGGANRRSIGLGAFIEARGVADAAVAGLKAAASSYTDLVRGGVARECGSSCVSECLHLSAVNRLVARIREAQAVVPGAIRRLVEIGLDAVVDAETRSALALRPADFVRIDRDWLDGASCSDVETAARALGVRRPTGKDTRYHFVWFLEPEQREFLEARGLDYWQRNCSRCLATGRRIRKAGHMGAAVHMVARKGSVQAAA